MRVMSRGETDEMRLEYLSIQVPLRILVVSKCISCPAPPPGALIHRPLSSSKITRIHYGSLL